MGGARTAALGLTAIGLACSSPPPPSPSAVIELAPSSVCQNDDFQTPIQLDGSQSAATLTLVPVAPDPDAPPLRFAWSFSGSDRRVVEGDAHSEKLAVTLAGDRPLHVSLEVENSEGGSARALATVAITLGGACP